MENPELLHCVQCHQLLASGQQFCSYCGAPNTVSIQVSGDQKWRQLKQLALFFGIELLCCLAALIPTLSGSGPIVFQLLMCISAVVFFILDWQENKYLLKWPSFSLTKLVAYLGCAIIIALLVDLLVTKLNYSFFNRSHSTSYFSDFESGRLLNYWKLAALTIIPALFEELAYRGYMMQKLLIVADRNEAIYISSILFFLIHLSFISFFWLLPFAIVLGYIRMKEQTLWYGIFIHFVFNLTNAFPDLIDSFF